MKILDDLRTIDKYDINMDFDDFLNELSSTPPRELTSATVSQTPVKENTFSIIDADIDEIFSISSPSVPQPIEHKSITSQIIDDGDQLDGNPENSESLTTNTLVQIQSATTLADADSSKGIEKDVFDWLDDTPIQSSSGLSESTPQEAVTPVLRDFIDELNQILFSSFPIQRSFARYWEK